MKIAILGLLCLFLPGMIFANSALTFEPSGKVGKLVLGGKEVLGSGSSSGFELEYKGGKSEPLAKIAVSGNKLRVAPSSGKPVFTFEIDSYPHHVAIHLLDAQGIGDGHDVALRLKLDAREVAVYTLNDRMSASSKRGTELSWPTLWGWPRPDGTRGSAVLYDGSLRGSERDAVLAEIWSVQGRAGHMVCPAGQKSWTEADVMAWVERWVKKFEKLVVVCIAPENEKELYEMTDKLVIPTGANRVYMFSTVWRGEYTLINLSNESVAGDAFPGGKTDLLRYSNYLAQHGAHLQLKSLVPQLGHEDERYFSDSYCEPRLLSWGSGSLAKALDEKETTLLFTPGPDYVWKRDSGYLRIGNELIFANKIATDGRDGPWVLSECKRGEFATSPKSHRAGEPVAGVSHAYGFVHFADDFGQPDSLAEKVLNAYGDFLKEVNAGHLHFDGTTSRMVECPWYLRDYTDYVYSRIDYPVTGSRVGGTIPANFERMFSVAARAAQATDYWDIRIGPRLHGMGRGDKKSQRQFAPNLLDMHFDISDRLVLGARRPNFTAGRSGGTLSMDILEQYGLLDEAIELFKNWIELAPVFDEADADYVKRYVKKGGGNHCEGEDVLVLGKNRDGNYFFTPHRVMGRTSGEDEPIKIDQEWGAVPRYQEIAAGTTMELFNPYEKQEPQVLICVEDGSTTLNDPLIKVNGSGGLAVTGAIQPGEYMQFNGGDRAKVFDSNWHLLRELPVRKKSFVMNEGKNAVTTEAGGSSDAPELKVQYITLGPVYVLESNKHL